MTNSTPPPVPSSYEPPAQPSPQPAPVRPGGGGGTGVEGIEALLNHDTFLTATPRPKAADVPIVPSGPGHAEALLQAAIRMRASDLHLATGMKPACRVSGGIEDIPGFEVLTAQDVLRVAEVIDPQAPGLLQKGDVDFGGVIPGPGDWRARGNLHNARRSPALVIRFLTGTVPHLAELGVPPTIAALSDLEAGLVLLAGETGSGKRLTLTTPVPTPSGWTTMGDLRVGDLVFGRDGSPCQVTGLSPIECEPDLWRIVFSDGQSVVADFDHQWLITDTSNPNKSEGVADRIGAVGERWDLGPGPGWLTATALHRVLTKAGLDGPFGNPGVVEAALTVMDCPTFLDPDRGVVFPVGVALKCLAQRVRQRVNGQEPGSGLVRMTTGEILADFEPGRFAVPTPGRLVLPETELPDNPYQAGTRLAATGDGIPGVFLRGSATQRTALLQGLIDTTATVTSDGYCEIGCTSAVLGADIAGLVRSLGIKATVTTVGDRTRVKFRVPGTVPGDEDQMLRVMNITPVRSGDDGYGPARCITVDSPDHTYLCGTGYLPTSNTTTHAALIDQINAKYTKTILTLEDPVEYLHRSKRSRVTQRELYTDFPAFERGLQSALRSDPDVILLGEIRSAESAEVAMNAAASGHLVLSTVHGRNVPQALARLVDLFPPEDHDHVRSLLSASIEAVVAQVLLRRQDDMSKRQVVCEVLRVDAGARGVIRSGRFEDLPNIIQSSQTSTSFEQQFAEHVAGGRLTVEQAMGNVTSQDLFRRYLQAQPKAAKVTL